MIVLELLLKGDLRSLLIQLQPPYVYVYWLINTVTVTSIDIANYSTAML